MPSRTYLQLVLQKLGVTSISAETGEEALEMMDVRTVDILLLDIALGAGMSGLDLGYKLHQDPRHADTPLVAVTAFSREKLELLEELGCDDSLGKPYTPPQLLELLQKYVPDRMSSPGPSETN